MIFLLFIIYLLLWKKIDLVLDLGHWILMTNMKSGWKEYVKREDYRNNYNKIKEELKEKENPEFLLVGF